jgi:hypothetical protein
MQYGSFLSFRKNKYEDGSEEALRDKRGRRIVTRELHAEKKFSIALLRDTERSLVLLTTNG